MTYRLLRRIREVLIVAEILSSFILRPQLGSNCLAQSRPRTGRRELCLWVSRKRPHLEKVTALDAPMRSNTCQRRGESGLVVSFSVGSEVGAVLNCLRATSASRAITADSISVSRWARIASNSESLRTAYCAAKSDTSRAPDFTGNSKCAGLTAPASKSGVVSAHKSRSPGLSPSHISGEATLRKNFRNFVV